MESSLSMDADITFVSMPQGSSLYTGGEPAVQDVLCTPHIDARNWAALRWDFFHVPLFTVHPFQC